jgi:hypothetical protein
VRLAVPATEASGAIRIAPVKGALDKRRFLSLVDTIYQDDRHWVAPLRVEVAKLLSPRKNPFFDDGEARFWLAWRGRQVVGRISAQINHSHLKLHRDETGHFGFLEAIDDQAVFDALLATAENWLRGRGMRRIAGPYSLSINDEVGVLISGFDSSPTVMMAHAPAYYAERVTQAGYRKIKDLHAYRLDLRAVNEVREQRLHRAAALVRADGRVTTRRLDAAAFDADMRLLLDIYNDAWEGNWGFLPVTEREARALIASVRPVIRPDLTVIAMIDGKAAAMAVALPDINELISDLGGRLFPFDWIKLLWRLKRGRPKSARVILAGVRKAYQDSIASGAMISLMLDDLLTAARAIGLEMVEFSWILEDNVSATAISRAGAPLSKVYRIYAKDLAATPAPAD